MSDPPKVAAPLKFARRMPITIRVNGSDVASEVPARTTLLDRLRETVGLTGTKKGCNEGACGTCTVLVDSKGRDALGRHRSAPDWPDLRIVDDDGNGQCGGRSGPRCGQAARRPWDRGHRLPRVASGRDRQARRLRALHAPGRCRDERRRRGHPVRDAHLGAIFVEIGVDADFGLLRLRRAVGVYSAGRILNPVTARAQMTGGIIWGWGTATMAESDQEPVHGCWLAKNLSNVAVPVNADIPADLDVSFIDEYDDAASLIGARGIGELGATGVDAAVAAAVHDAVGVRVRDLPILPWKVLSGG